MFWYGSAVLLNSLSDPSANITFHMWRTHSWQTLSRTLIQNTLWAALRAPVHPNFSLLEWVFRSCSGKSSVETRALGCNSYQWSKYIRCLKMYEHLTPYFHIQAWSDLLFLTNNHHVFFPFHFFVSFHKFSLNSLSSRDNVSFAVQSWSNPNNGLKIIHLILLPSFRSHNKGNLFFF